MNEQVSKSRNTQLSVKRQAQLKYLSGGATVHPLTTHIAMLKSRSALLIRNVAKQQAKKPTIGTHIPTCCA